MTKRVLSILLVCAMLFTTLPMTSHAVLPEHDEIDASNYLSGYGATLYSEGATGELKLWYEVYAKATMSSVGVSKIVVKKSNGTIVRTIWGSTTNGLLAANYWFHNGTYTISGLTSGTSYYCVVTVIAGNSSGADTRTVTTTAVTCP